MSPRMNATAASAQRRTRSATSSSVTLSFGMIPRRLSAVQHATRVDEPLVVRAQFRRPLPAGSPYRATESAASVTERELVTGPPRVRCHWYRGLAFGLRQVDLGVLIGRVAGRLGRGVDEIEHTGLERLRRDERERDRRLALVEQPHALADGERMQQEVQLVQQPRGDQLADDRDRATQADRAVTGLVLQRGDRLDEVALQLLGVAPGELELLVRHDDLADVAELLGEGGVLLAGRFPLGPCSGEAVVGRATE